MDAALDFIRNVVRDPFNPKMILLRKHRSSSISFSFFIHLGLPKSFLGLVLGQNPDSKSPNGNEEKN